MIVPSGLIDPMSAPSRLYRYRALSVRCTPWSRMRSVSDSSWPNRLKTWQVTWPLRSVRLVRCAGRSSSPYSTSKDCRRRLHVEMRALPAALPLPHDPVEVQSAGPPRPNRFGVDAPRCIDDSDQVVGELTAVLRRSCTRSTWSARSGYSSVAGVVADRGRRNRRKPDHVRGRRDPAALPVDRCLVVVKRHHSLRMIHARARQPLLRVVEFDVVAVSVLDAREPMEERLRRSCSNRWRTPCGARHSNDAPC